MKKKIVMGLFVLAAVIGMGFAGTCERHNLSFYGSNCPSCAEERAAQANREAEKIKKQQELCNEYKNKANDKSLNSATRKRNKENFDAWCSE